MNQSEALAKLRALYSTAFTTRDAAHLLGVTVNATAKLLDRLARVGLLVRIMRGRWVVPDKFNRLCLPELVAGESTYVSMQSALSFHGMIDQIPSCVYGVTCGRGMVQETPLGRVSLHHVTPEFYTGYDTPTDIAWLKIATPEKALVDTLYLRMSSKGDFKSLPELEFPDEFDWKQAEKFASLSQNKSRRTMMLEALERLQNTPQR